MFLVAMTYVYKINENDSDNNDESVNLTSSIKKVEIFYTISVLMERKERNVDLTTLKCPPKIRHCYSLGKLSKTSSVWRRTRF